MSIFLLVLKIIGITFLVILGLILLIALLILFVPFVYNAELIMPSKDLDELNARFKVSFLFFISFIGSYTKKDSFNAFLKIFFIKIRLDKSKDENKESKSDTSKEEKFNNKKADDVPLNKNDTSIKNTASTDESPAAKTNFTDSFKDKHKNKDVKKQKKKKAKKEKSGGFMKLKEEIKFYYRMLKDERNKKAFGFVFDKLKKIAKHYGPRRIKGHALFGFSDPANTGYLTGLISMFPVVYSKKFDITPRFDVDETFIDIDINAKGRMVTFYLLWYTILILTNKNIRRLVKKYKAHTNAA